MKYDLVIVGAGPAGLSAGIYGVRSGLSTLVLEKAAAGGLVGEASLIENYPGLGAMKGKERVKKLKEHAAEYVDIKEQAAVKTIKIGRDILVITEKEEYLAEAVIIATGTTYRKLGVKGEKDFFGKGVSYCSTCDGFFFKGKKVAVVGGGNTAVTDAIYLDNLGCDVTLIHRRDKLRAEEYLQKKLPSKVKLCLNSELEEIMGDTSVRRIKVLNKEKQIRKELEVNGVFVSIGWIPNSELAKKIGVGVDEEGYVLTDKTQRTNVSKVYAAGDVTGGVKQMVVACSEGAIAALSAFEDIKHPYWGKSR